MGELFDELEEPMDDIGLIKAEYMSKIIGDDVEEFNSSQVPTHASITEKQIQELIDQSISKPIIQEPFQPGATEGIGNKYKRQIDRFLCWNNVGIMRANCEVMKQENDEAKNEDEDKHGNKIQDPDDMCIDVVFHDAERHPYINLKNDSNYTFGSLSDDVIVVGTNGQLNTGPARLMGFNLLEPNRDKRQWEIDIPPAELIEGLAAGTGFIAVVTDLRFLRLFSNGGMQSIVLSLPGQILSISALEQRLMIVYNRGLSIDGHTSLSMLLYHVDIFNNKINIIYDNIPVALTRRSRLEWIGLSDEGNPCTYDHSKILRIYDKNLGWIPILNLDSLTSSRVDHYFVIGVNEFTQTVRAAKCKQSRYPDFKTETADILSYKMPLCDAITARGTLEEQLVRLKLKDNTISQMHDQEHAIISKETNEKLIVNNILKLFSIYLREDKEEMAKNLVFMMPLAHAQKLPEFAWKTNRKPYFIDSLNNAIEERLQSKTDLESGQSNPDR